MMSRVIVGIVVLCIAIGMLTVCEASPPEPLQQGKNHCNSGQPLPTGRTTATGQHCNRGRTTATGERTTATGRMLAKTWGTLSIDLLEFQFM
ncbi:hypothetical protein Ocin01_18172 [Orchesella cincta]|uniref:Secreted protein n=1 Tax=Orchesella cincta TaxID=48709 RepID=A0A1D2M699_ORCCI|nr:hypothetical protein Ocin01_18172 [Orchesella cincta]